MMSDNDLITKGIDLFYQHGISIETSHKLAYGEGSVTCGPHLISELEYDKKRCGGDVQYEIDSQVKKDMLRLHNETVDKIKKTGLESKLHELGMYIFIHIRIFGNPKTPIHFV